jgi:hypothetical protein
MWDPVQYRRRRLIVDGLLTPIRRRAKVGLGKKEVMRKAILAVLALVCVGGTPSAFSQAAAEAILTHSMSTATGTKVGTALGRATNQLAGRVAQQTSNATSRPAIHTTKPIPQKQTRAPRSVAATPEQPGRGSLIASIQGAAPQPTAVKCAPAAPAAEPKNAQANSVAGQSNCAANKAVTTSHDENAYQSVITLPAAK